MNHIKELIDDPFKEIDEEIKKMITIDEDVKFGLIYALMIYESMVKILKLRIWGGTENQSKKGGMKR